MRNNLSSEGNSHFNTSIVSVKVIIAIITLVSADLLAWEQHGLDFHLGQCELNWPRPRGVRFR